MPGYFGRQRRAHGQNSSRRLHILDLSGLIPVNVTTGSLDVSKVGLRMPPHQGIGCGAGGALYVPVVTISCPEEKRRLAGPEETAFAPN